MEIKINKEIRNYHEQLLMGLNWRQIIYTGAGIAVALILGFNLRGKVSDETMSWIIPCAIIPFFLFGFKKVNGMHMEKFIAAWFKSTFLIPRKLVLREDNVYKILLEESKNEKKKRKT